MKTTKKHFAIFKGECERLKRLWGLSGWTMHVYHEQMEAGTTAWLDCHVTNRKLSISFSTEFPDRHSLSSAHIKEIARHEMVHALLEPMRAIGESRFITRDEWIAANHEVLEHLLKLLP